MSSRRFPCYSSHDVVFCFNCTATLSGGTKSGNAQGEGEFRAECPTCRMATWYDICVYRIVRTNRDETGPAWIKIVETGIVGFAAAKAKAEALQRAEDLAHPERDSWTKDLFIPEREQAATSGRRK